jgi:hypothetical protein
MSTPFQGRVEELNGHLPAAQFRWDPETEILSCRLADIEGPGGYTGAIELADPRGPIITLDMQDGTLLAVEVVVWPEVATVADLRPPEPARTGRLRVPPRPSQPGIALTEVELAMQGRRTPDESVIHLTVGPRRRTEPIQLARGLLIEMDDQAQPAGFWLLDVPPFPHDEDAR